LHYDNHCNSCSLLQELEFIPRIAAQSCSLEFQGLKPNISRLLNIAAEAATHNACW
jgi:hypothetical protein